MQVYGLYYPFKLVLHLAPILTGARVNVLHAISQHLNVPEQLRFNSTRASYGGYDYNFRHTGYMFLYHSKYKSTAT